jgi:hypothetical protein
MYEYDDQPEPATKIFKKNGIHGIGSLISGSGLDL